MAVTLNKANLVLKDANGNIGKIEQLSDRDLAKIKTAVSDVALVVNQSNHKPIAATTTNKGVVQLATYSDVASGAIDKVVTAEQLHNATTGTSALAIENLARIDAVVTAAGISVDHTNTNQLKTAVTTLVNNAVPSTATSNTLGVVKPDNDTITIDSNGVLTATKAIRDKNGAQIDTTYFKSANGTFTGTEYFRNVNNDLLRFNGGNTHNGGACLMLYAKNSERTPGIFDLVACTKEDGSDSKQLIGRSNGSLTWAGKNIVRSVNSVNADDNGNVSITSVNHATNADHATSADSATKATQDSAGQQINTTYVKGVTASNATITVTKGNGTTSTATINNVANATKATQDKNGAQIDTTYFKSANGTFTGRDYYRDVNNDLLRLNGGNTHNGGACLMLYGMNANNVHGDGTQGIFDLVACNKEDGSGSKQLIGRSNGSLTWAGKEIERVELKNGNYIRFTSGLTLMWGKVNIPAGTKKQTVNLPIPFKSDYVVSLANGASPNSDSGFTVSYQVREISLSAFNILHTFEGATGWAYFAVGY